MLRIEVHFGKVAARLTRRALGAQALRRVDKWDKSTYLLQIELDLLKNFLDHVVEESGAEYLDIMRRNEEGGFGELAELEEALDYPVARQELAARTVYYEVNALVEHELCGAAHGPWSVSVSYPGPKTLDWNNLDMDSIRSLRMVEDLRFGEITRLIEKEYGIRLNELQGWQALSSIREAVNAFKHRRGLIDFRRKIPEEMRIGIRYCPDVETAYEALEQARVFIEALWVATDCA